MTRSREIALRAGLNYVYTGNVHDFRGSSTYCPACGQLLIGRDWYTLSTFDIDADGRCGACKAAIAGVFH